MGLGIMAVGALGAFVLFPLSAINVSKALIDDRATTCAISADGQLRDIHRQYVAEPESRGGASGEPYFTAMDSGVATTDPGPSLPVFVDPMGRWARLGAPGVPSPYDFVGDAGQTGIPRVSLSFIGDKSQALRYCSQMDGLTFGENGEATGPQAELRELRYNWLWVLQRPVNRDRLNVRQQVVVFDRRVHMYAPTGSEAVYAASFTPGDTLITGIPNTAEIRKGTWVMDAGNPNAGLRHAEFYRVVSVVEAPGGTYALEVHKPVVRADGLISRAAVNPYTYTGNLVVMPTVVEVFERPMLTGNTGQ